jgi:hypothetical protein
VIRHKYEEWKMHDLVKRSDGDADRVIKGQLLSFDANAGRWNLDDKPPPAGLRLLVGGTTAVAQRWLGGKPAGTVWPSGQSLVDVVAEGNESIPEDQWELDQSGKRKQPWAISRVVYLIDPNTAKKFTVAASTTGQRIAVELLEDQIDTMRQLRGTKVYAEIELGVTTFATRFGTRKPRPDYVVIGWRGVGTDTVPLALPKVEKPTLAEQMDDGLPF